MFCRFLRAIQIQRIMGNFQKVIGLGGRIWLTFPAYRGPIGPLEVPMIATLTPTRRLQAALTGCLRRLRPILSLFTLLIVFPAIAIAQSPFDTEFTAVKATPANVTD